MNEDRYADYLAAGIQKIIDGNIKERAGYALDSGNKMPLAFQLTLAEIRELPEVEKCE